MTTTKPSEELEVFTVTDGLISWSYGTRKLIDKHFYTNALKRIEALEADIEYRKQSYCSLDEVNYVLNERIQSAVKRIDKLEAENAKLREALEWYANPYNWDLSTEHSTDVFDRIDCTDLYVPDELCDLRGGKRARLALRECEGGNA